MEQLLLPPTTLIAIVDGSTRLRIERETVEEAGWGLEARYAINPADFALLRSARSMEMRIGGLEVRISQRALTALRGF